MQIDFNHTACVYASYWLMEKYKTWPCVADFEKEFHCKVVDSVVYFDYPRDYTWFMLKWSTNNETI